MLETTFDAIKAILKADPSVPMPERNHHLALLREKPGAPKPESPKPAAPRILRRKEVAERLGRSLRSVDMLAREGVLKKLRLPNRKRCCGFREDDVNKLLT